MRIILIILGVLMLLPGACGAIFTMVALTDPVSNDLLELSLPGLAVGIVGIYLIRRASRS